MRKLTVGSLFSGIGGMDLGLEQTGRFDIVWQIENDAYRQQILAQQWPDVTRFRDVRTCGKHNLTKVDALAGGFPCQNISLSNTTGPIGIDGPQSGLWGEFFRIICELQPRYVIVENVAALLGRGISRILAELASIGCDAEWTVLRACDFGAPHERARLFIVAYPYQERWTPRLCADQPPLHRLYPLWQTSDPLDDVWHRLTQLEERLGQPSVFSRYDGVSRHLERELAAYGDAVVPQVAAWVGSCIAAWENAQHEAYSPTAPGVRA